MQTLGHILGDSSNHLCHFLGKNVINIFNSSLIQFKNNFFYSVILVKCNNLIA